MGIELRVWLVTVGEPLPTDDENVRLLRTGIVAGMLAARGHEVVWWTSAFDHFQKSLRAPGYAVLTGPGGMRIHLLEGGGYRRNISLARVRDHRRLAARFRDLAPAEARPDVIVVSFPPLELALAAVEFGKARGIPAVLDVRDLWPDVIFDLAPAPLRPLVRTMFRNMTATTRKACAAATHIWGHAPAFVEWGLAHAGRAATVRDRAYYFGYMEEPPAPAAVAAAEAMWDAQGIGTRDTGLIACFTGTIGHQFDMKTVIDAARLLRDRPGIRFVLCGSGDRVEETRAYARDLPNVLLPGWRNRAEIWTLLRRASVGLAPYLDRPDFVATIPNKAAEYLSGGLPIAWSLGRGLLHDLVTSMDCGFSYGGSAESLAARLLDMERDPVARHRMSQNATALFERRFRADAVYGEMIDDLEKIARGNG